MSHEPPIPPGSRSPYPIAEAPRHPSRSIAGRALLVGGAVAAAGVALAGGVAALLLRRRKR
jgi:hypothetical protein